MRSPEEQKGRVLGKWFCTPGLDMEVPEIFRKFGNPDIGRESRHYGTHKKRTSDMVNTCPTDVEEEKVMLP